jgi:hypothetical protein
MSEPSSRERVRRARRASGDPPGTSPGFSVRIIADPALAGYFAGVDLDAIRAHQVELLAAAVGGPQR